MAALRYTVKRPSINLFTAVRNSPISAAFPALQKQLHRVGVRDDGRPVLFVDSAKQTLQFWNGRRLRAEYMVSTSKHGLGTEQDSGKTPPGAHRIAEKVGDDAPADMIFRGRRPTGQRAAIEHADRDTGIDAITARVLSLRGIEPANENTQARHIYIHGTNEEGRIGKPVSHGCVRMRNADIIALYPQVREGDLVIIT